MRPILINISVLNQKFTIHRFDQSTPLPIDKLKDESIFHISRTHDELSLVCRYEVDIKSDLRSGPYRCLKVLGPLDFDLVGIIAKLTSILMKRDIPVFVISTFDTDYILINESNADAATNALSEDEYISITITPN